MPWQIILIQLGNLQHSVRVLEISKTRKFHPVIYFWSKANKKCMKDDSQLFVGISFHCCPETGAPTVQLIWCNLFTGCKITGSAGNMRNKIIGRLQILISFSFLSCWSRYSNCGCFASFWWFGEAKLHQSLVNIPSPQPTVQNPQPTSHSRCCFRVSWQWSVSDWSVLMKKLCGNVFLGEFSELFPPFFKFGIQFRSVASWDQRFS
jgi:hypothetical protein